MVRELLRMVIMSLMSSLPSSLSPRAKLRLVSGKTGDMAEPLVSLPHDWHSVLFGFVLGILPKVPDFFVWLGKRFENSQERNDRERDQLYSVLKDVLADQKETIHELKAQNLEQANEMESLRHDMSELQKNVKIV
jgi:hypothetical protein